LNKIDLAAFYEIGDPFVSDVTLKSLISQRGLVDLNISLSLLKRTS